MIATALTAPRRFWFTLLGATLTLGCLVLAGDRPPPEALRERARALQQEIRELHANGQHEQAERLQMELREMRENAERLARARVEGDRDRPRPPEAAAEQREMIRKIRQLNAEGRQEAAAELREELARRQREQGWRAGAPQPRVGRGEPMPPEEMERRLHHLQVAIENLHAAGMPDVAERLEQEAQRRRQGLGAGRELAAPMERLGAELGRVRAELEELRANLAELRQHIAELHREREER